MIELQIHTVRAVFLTLLSIGYFLSCSFYNRLSFDAFNIKNPFLAVMIILRWLLRILIEKIQMDHILIERVITNSLVCKMSKSSEGEMRRYKVYKFF